MFTDDTAMTLAVKYAIDNNIDYCAAMHEVGVRYPANQYSYTVDSDLDAMEKSYRWDVSCQGSVPVAMKCFLDSDSYESFLRNVFRLECDSDTLGAIGGAVAEEFYHGTGLSEMMNKSRRTAQLLMKELLEEDAIERIGSRKTGSWIVNLCFCHR